MIFNLSFDSVEIPPFLKPTTISTISKFPKINYLTVALECPTQFLVLLKWTENKISFILIILFNLDELEAVGSFILLLHFVEFNALRAYALPWKFLCGPIRKAFKCSG